MTGFGRSEASDSGIQVSVEVKTVNSRYLDISTRMPNSIQDKEVNIKEAVQKVMSRGKALINVYVDRTATGTPKVTYNKDLLTGYGKMLKEMKAISNIDEPLQLKDLFQFDDIFESRKDDEESIEVIWGCTNRALDKALQQLNEMRMKEGKELENDLRQNITDIHNLLDQVIEKSDERAPDVRTKLQERIKNMVSEESFNPERMEMEVAILVDKMDINEEVVRLQSHLKFFLEALESEEKVGRRLNFLCQEINRELNTIGSKANDSSISHDIVICKEKLEQIREQVQNVE